MSSQAELVERARLLAEALSSGAPAVKRSSFESIIADFTSSPRPDAGRLRRILTLLGQGSGGHLKRGGSFPEQAQRVVREIIALLDESSDLDPRQLQTLLGWTGRLLSTRSSTRKPPERRAQQQDRRPEHRQHGFTGSEGRAPAAGGRAGFRLERGEPPQLDRPDGNISRKQAALDAYRRQLEEKREKEGGG